MSNACRQNELRSIKFKMDDNFSYTYQVIPYPLSKLKQFECKKENIEKFCFVYFDRGESKHVGKYLQKLTEGQK